MLLYFPGCLIINVNEILILSQASLQPNASLAAAHANVELGHWKNEGARCLRGQVSPTRHTCCLPTPGNWTTRIQVNVEPPGDGTFWSGLSSRFVVTYNGATRGGMSWKQGPCVSIPDLLYSNALSTFAHTSRLQLQHVHFNIYREHGGSKEPRTWRVLEVFSALIEDNRMFRCNRITLLQFCTRESGDMARHLGQGSVPLLKRTVSSFLLRGTVWQEIVLIPTDVSPPSAPAKHFTPAIRNGCYAN